MLFDRKNDPTEDKNLAQRRPKVIKELLKLEKQDWKKRPQRKVL